MTAASILLLLAAAAMIACLPVLAWIHRRDTARDRRRIDALERDIAMRIEAGDMLQHAKDAADAANEAKTRYLVGISHEIRSPLNAIYGYAQLLERDDAVAGAEAGAVIRRSAEHLTNLVEGLLEISRIESGVLKVRFDLVNIRGLLDQVVGMFRMQAASKGLSLDLVIRDRMPPYVRTDEKRLRQILINLVSNAVKYTDEGGITIRVGHRSQVADIEVSDTGIGIAPEDIERVFEPFERGGSAAAQRQPGIGLGLAITQMLARVLGGDVAVTSEPGRGSTFRLRMMLPAATGFVAGNAQGNRITGYRGARRTLVVIDDDPAQHAVLRSFLTPLGFVVHAGGNGADGIALAQRHAPDIVLLDIQMPGMSGWDTAAGLRAACGDALKIVIVSADAHDFRAGGDGRDHHDAFVVKPIALDELLVVIGSQLGLSWEEQAPAPTSATIPAPAVSDRRPPLPAEAIAFLPQLRQLARIGHVRGIEDMLADLERAVPAATDLASILHRQARDFDFRSFLRTLDDADPS